MSAYRFASPEWIACIHGIMTAKAAAADLDGVDFSMCEVFTDVPTDVHPDGRSAWWVRIRDGVMTFGAGEIDDVHRKIVADWTFIEPVGRTVFADDPAAAAEVQKTMAAAVADGRITVSGSFAAATGGKAANPFEDVHDLIARLTV